jgi:RNA polymerase sigma-70 factor (ECF subfamily)
MSATSLAIPQTCWAFETKARNSIAQLSEVEIVALAAKGDARAFEFLYRRNSARVHAVCLRMTGNPEEAEDLTQEVFMQVFRKVGTFRGEACFSTWLHRLTVNAVLMRLRKKRRPEVPIDGAPKGDEYDFSPAIMVAVEDLKLKGLFDRVNLEKAVAELPDGYRQIFILHDVEGYEHNEIATLLGCSIGNSKSQLFKARQKLRGLLKRHLTMA